MFKSIQAKAVLQLKKGAHVSCVRNRNDSCIINGSFGKVVDLAQEADVRIEELMPAKELPFGIFGMQKQESLDVATWHQKLRYMSLIMGLGGILPPFVTGEQFAKVHIGSL